MSAKGFRTISSIIWVMAVSPGILGGCSWIPKGETQFDVGIKDRGVASWYGSQFHGRQAANGAMYDMEGLTAAHRTIPLGSILRVVNLTNGKYLHVQVTDRGPYAQGRILDLSHAAAVRLEMETSGITIVQIEVVGERRPDLLISSASLPHAYPLHVLGNILPELSHTAVLRYPSRTLHSDLWIRRGMRRVPALLETGYTAHTGAATLVLS